MVGSMGCLGAMVDVTFKVFPQPEAYATMQVDCASPDEALNLLPKLTNCQYDLNAIDIAVGAQDIVSIRIRAGGLADGLPQRMDRVRALCGKGEIIIGATEEAIWREARELQWVGADAQVVKVPLTPSRMLALDARLRGMQRLYSVGGNVAWIAAPEGHDLDATLKSLSLSGLIVLNAAGDPRIGAHAQNAFAKRVKHAIDPLGKFAH
jgi:glycolate oxidase FAD binding subunit